MVDFGHAPVAAWWASTHALISFSESGGASAGFRFPHSRASSFARLSPPGSPRTPTASALFTPDQVSPGASGIGPDFTTGQPPVRAAWVRAHAAIRSAVSGGRADMAAEVGGGHGRAEERYVTVVEHPEGLPDGWAGVGAVALVCREREVGGKANESTAHYYLTSLRVPAAVLAGYIRAHWGIENTQSDDPRSDNLCVAGRSGYDLRGGPSRADRVVQPTPGPRRPVMRLDSPARVPPRPHRRRPD